MEDDRWIDGILIIGIIVVIALKITGVIMIPWIWLTAIIWGPILLGIVILITTFTWYTIEEYIDKKRRMKK